jgi:uncharacterized membrane protein YkoI
MNSSESIRKIFGEGSMKGQAFIWGVCVLFCGAAWAQKRLTLKDLPASVQATVQKELDGGEIKSIGRETEHGVSQYEIETIRNGKHRDFNVDTKGRLVVIEEETTLESVPPAAKAAILKKVADGKLGMVELFKRDGETMYEAAYTTKAGKKHEVLVKADGTETKD